MTSEMLQAAVASLVIGTVTSYLCWCRLRVILIRQQMFAIRDELWDAARAADGLDDPAYREARDRLNACIRHAHSLSLPLMVRLEMHRDAADLPEPTISSDPELQRQIEVAIAKAFIATYRYVYFYRFFSGIVWAKAFLFAFNVQEAVRKWFSGGGPMRMDYALQPCR